MAPLGPDRFERTRTSSLVKGNLHGSIGSTPAREDSTLSLVKGTFRGLGLLLRSPVSMNVSRKSSEGRSSPGFQTVQIVTFPGVQTGSRGLHNVLSQRHLSELAVLIASQHDRLHEEQ